MLEGYSAGGLKCQRTIVPGSCFAGYRGTTVVPGGGAVPGCY